MGVSAQFDRTVNGLRGQIQIRLVITHTINDI